MADEPTTALDVTVQAQIITLLLKLREELGFALILDDLALVADVTDRVVVMYGGQIVETGVTADLVEAPAHHYTRGLLGSVLSLESVAERMTQIKGVVPAPADFPAGCRFADRCPLASEVVPDDGALAAGQPDTHGRVPSPRGRSDHHGERGRPVNALITLSTPMSSTRPAPAACSPATGCTP